MPEALINPIEDDWKIATLGEFCRSGGGDIQTGPFGSQLHASDYVQVGIPSVMPQDIGDNVIIEDSVARITSDDASRLSRYLLREGDIVYSRRGDVERRALVRQRENGWLCGTGCLRVRVGTSANSRFLSYYLGHPEVRKWIVRHAIGATMPNLNTAILSAVPVTLPPPLVQSAIAALLGALDDKIAVNGAMSRTSYELAQAIFSTQNTARESALSSIIDLRYGKALPEDVREPGNVPVFGSNGRSGWHSQPLSRGPGIIIGRKGANAGSVSWSHVPFWAIDTAFFVHPISKDIPMEYLYLLLETVDFRKQVGDSAIPGLNREIALACTIALPPNDVISRIASQVRPLLKLSDHMSEESSSLASLRDTLLPRLMSGEIRVRDAERIVEDAT